MADDDDGDHDEDSESPALTPEYIRSALDGDALAFDHVITTLYPSIHAEVAAVLRCFAPPNVDHRQEIRDFVNEVFLYILTAQEQTLGRWAPHRGSQLKSFIRLITRNRMINMLQSRRNPWAEPPVEADRAQWMLTRRVDELQPALTHADQIVDLLARLEAESLDIEIFHRLYVEGRSIREVCELTDLTRYKISQYRQQVADIVRDLSGEDKRGECDHD